MVFSDDSPTGEGQGVSPPTTLKFIPIHHLNPACSENVSVCPDQYLLGFCGCTSYPQDTAAQAMTAAICSRNVIYSIL